LIPAGQVLAGDLRQAPGLTKCGNGPHHGAPQVPTKRPANRRASGPALSDVSSAASTIHGSGLEMQFAAKQGAESLVSRPRYPFRRPQFGTLKK